MEDKFEKIEKKLDLLLEKVAAIDEWIGNFNKDFLSDSTDYNESAMFSWFNLADSVERMESILFALNQKFNLNPEEMDMDLNKKVADLQIKNEKLRKELEAVRNAGQFNKAVAEGRVQEWQHIVDEMAHSIDTDVYVAVANLDKHKDLPRINKAAYHVKQIRDLTNLLMWYINRNRLISSGELTSLNINETLHTQIETIKEGISTLRISSDEHQENILKMEIQVETEGDVTVLITKEISDAVSLVLKDLLRNAIKNTNEEHPEVKIKIIGNEISVAVEIQNNQVISKEFSSWFNNETLVEPEKMSKSARVGLRVIKMWIDLLKIDAKLLPDYQNNLTTARIIFPKEIRYEKN